MTRAQYFSPIHDHLDPATPCACDNCEWNGEITETNQIKDPSARLSVGEVIPAGECPECGACAHLESDPLNNAAPELLDVVQRFVSACDAYLPQPTHQAFCGIFASAREAIAKATEENPK